MFPTRCYAATLLLLLAACDMPQLPDQSRLSARQAPYPALLPIAEIVSLPEQSSADTDAMLRARAAALRARARSLRAAYGG